MKFAGISPSTLEIDKETKIDRDLQNRTVDISWFDENLHDKAWAGRWFALWNSESTERLIDLGLTWLKATGFQGQSVALVIGALLRSGSPRAERVVLAWLSATNPLRHEWPRIWIAAATANMSAALQEMGLSNLNILVDAAENKSSWLRVWSLLHAEFSNRDKTLDVARRYMDNNSIETSAVNQMIVKVRSQLPHEIGSSDAVLSWLTRRKGGGKNWSRMFCTVYEVRGPTEKLIKTGLSWLQWSKASPRYWRRVWTLLSEGCVSPGEMLHITSAWLSNNSGKYWSLVLLESYDNGVWDEEVRGLAKKWLSDHSTHPEAARVAELLARADLPMEPLIS
jgi:hypothetical protein